ncbi:MAG: hypothetical protein II829_05245 [Bacteroidales bacterium]|nr:hypothetical protein [Bacteroidales bacterium]
METKQLSTVERNEIKKSALSKLDLLIEAELNRLYVISPNKINLNGFEINVGDKYFTDEELNEIQRSIDQLNMVSSNDEEIITIARNYLKVALQFRPIEWPWEQCL